MQSVADRPDRRVSQLADGLDKLRFIDREDLRYIHHAGLREVGFAFLQEHVARRICAAQIRSDQAYHGCSNGTPVENVVLDNHARMALRGRGTGCRSEIEPVDLPLAEFAHQRSRTVEPTLALIL